MDDDGGGRGEGFGAENETYILAPWRWRGIMVSMDDNNEGAWMMMARAWTTTTKEMDDDGAVGLWQDLRRRP